MVFPVVVYGCESWTIKKADRQWVDAFELCVVFGEDSWESLDCKEIHPVHPKGNQFLHIHWKNWCWSWSSNTLAIWCEELTHWKIPWFWERLRAEKGTTEDVMAGWHHWLDRHEFEQAGGVDAGQGNLACYSSWVTEVQTRLGDWTDWLTLSFARMLSHFMMMCWYYLLTGKLLSLVGGILLNYSFDGFLSSVFYILSSWVLLFLDTGPHGPILKFLVFFYITLYSFSFYFTFWEISLTLISQLL